MRKWILVALLIISPLPLYSRAKLQGWVEAGNTTLTITGGVGTISRKVQGSYPGATVTIYNTGTVVLSTIYADNSGTAKPNPFTSSADGSWFAYIDSGRYDVRFSGGNISAPFTIGDLIANDSDLNLWLNVKSYGATGLGITDDTPYIQAAINASVTTGISQVYFPAGIYKFTSLTLPRKVSLVGLEMLPGVVNAVNDDRTGSVLLQSGSSATGITVIRDTTKSQAQSTIKNLKLISNDYTGYAGIDIQAFDCKLENIQIRGYKSGYGLILHDSWRTPYYNVTITQCGVGVLFAASLGASSSHINATPFYSLVIEECRIGIYARAIAGGQANQDIDFYTILIESVGPSISITDSLSVPIDLNANVYDYTTTWGFATQADIAGAIFIEPNGVMTFHGGYFEDIGGYVYATNDSTGDAVNFLGTFFTFGTGTEIPNVTPFSIQKHLLNVTGCTFFADGTLATPVFDALHAGGQGVTIYGNKWRDMAGLPWTRPIIDPVTLLVAHNNAMIQGTDDNWLITPSRMVPSYILNTRDTWTDISKTYTHWFANVVDTASTAGSILLDLEVGGVPKFRSYKSGTVEIAATAAYSWAGRNLIRSPADGKFTLTDSTEADINLVQFGGTTSGHPALKRSGANLLARLANDSAYTGLGGSSYIFKGTAFDTTLTFTNPGAARTVTFPDASITVPGTRSYNGGTTATYTPTNISSTVIIHSGTVALSSATPSIATVSAFSPAFASATSYVCTVTPEGNTATIADKGIAVVKSSGTQIVITGPDSVTTVVDYVCIGI